MSARIDRSEIATRCWRSDHNQGRLVNGRRELADEKHGDKSIEALEYDDPAWMPILVEEVGEIAHGLTYDGATGHDERWHAIANELLDAMAVCGAWLDALREEGIHPDAKGTWLA